MTATHVKLAETASLVVNELLAVAPGEQVALVTDDKTPDPLVRSVAVAVHLAGAEYSILQLPERGLERANELTPVIARALHAADCLIGLTASSGAPTYSKVTRKLLDERRLRVLSMVMRPIEIFTGGGAGADYEALHAEAAVLAAAWDRAGAIRITSASGTDLTASVDGIDAIIECGYATRPGDEAAFTDGEVSSRPAEGTTNGLLVVDGPVAHVGTPSSPMKLTISDGRVEAIDGGGAAGRELRHIIQTVPEATNIAEIGIGINGSCRRNGLFEEEKKGRGNIHIALGDNVFYGGSVECAVHIDMVGYDHSVEFDSDTIVDRGHLVLAAADQATTSA